MGSETGRIPVWPIKSMVSNTGAAAGAIDLIAGIFAMRDGLIPPAKNFNTKVDGCNLNISNGKKTEIRCVLCCGYTYGGQTAAIVIKKFEN
jgi:3-oxoacyl-(acyl-carrier-protein) synthase